MELFIIFFIGIFLGVLGSFIGFGYTSNSEKKFIDNGNVKIKPKPNLKKEDVPNPPPAVPKKAH